MHDLPGLRKRLLRGWVIPAHPLALTEERKLDERHQRALTRYYLDAGAGGVAVGVHTTQFEIHNPNLGLYRPVLELAVEEAKQFAGRTGTSPLMVAGLVGKTEQAVREGTLARELGYECGLLSLGAMREAGEEELIEHARRVSEAIPLFGFYLQPSVGGRILSFAFWRCFAGIEDVVAIKIAPFNRYQTLDVVRAVAEAGRETEIALYTGNDDNIVVDLLTRFRFGALGPEVRMVGGLLGHWAVWTRRAVELLEEIRDSLECDPSRDRVGAASPEGESTADFAGPLADAHGSEGVPTRSRLEWEWLALNAQITDANAALFDPQHEFAGSIAGIHEVLRRQGLLRGRWCLNPKEDLSPGQMEEIDRVYAAYPQLHDDDFVREHRDRWLSA